MGGRQKLLHLIPMTSSKGIPSVPLPFAPSRQSQTRGIFSLLRNMMGNGNEDKMDKQRKAQAADALRTAMVALSGSKPLPDVTEISKLSSIPVEQLSTGELEDLAKCYYEGIGGLQKDPHKAFKIWNEGSRKGSSECKYSVASCLRNGEGLSGEHEKVKEMENERPKRDRLEHALQIFKELADSFEFKPIIRDASKYDASLEQKSIREQVEPFRANIQAQYALAVMYDNGEGTEVNHEAAFKYYKLAAQGGVPPAYFNLGNAYAQGKGIVVNNELALQYYEIAAEVGDINAKFTLGNWYTNGEYEKRLGKSINPFLRRQGYVFIREAASSGNPVAAFNMGLFCCAETNEFTTQNYEEAVEWYSRAISGGFTHACINLGTMYRTGLGVDKDITKSMEVFEIGAQRGDQTCKDILDIMKNPELFDIETGNMKDQ